MANPQPPAVHVQTGSSQLDVSQHTANSFIDAIKEKWADTLETWERMYYRTLDWGNDHPFLFALVVGLLAWWLYLRYKGKTEITRMKTEYKNRRQLTQQNELPFEPAKNREAGL